jgi:hypothetical protein
MVQEAGASLLGTLTAMYVALGVGDWRLEHVQDALHVEAEACIQASIS